MRIFGSGVIDRFRLGFEICIFKFCNCNPIKTSQDKTKTKTANRYHEDRDRGSSGSVYEIRNFVNPGPSGFGYGSSETGQLN